MSDRRDDVRALHALLTDCGTQNSTIGQLAARIERFNLFEALGITNRELSHSNFLAFLLDPRRNHGLGDAFLTSFLSTVFASTRRGPWSTPVPDVDPRRATFPEVSVQREYRNIDLLVRDDTRQMAVIIENKIWSGLQDKQLERYYAIVKNTFQYPYTLGVYLTPTGVDPTCRHFVAMSYAEVGAILAGVVATTPHIRHTDVGVVIRHYADLLGRHIVNQSDIADLCRSIDREHRKAIDLVIEYRERRRRDVQAELEGLVRKVGSSLTLDDSTTKYVFFTPTAWTSPRLQLVQKGRWTKSCLILLFAFVYAGDTLTLTLTVGPGDKEKRDSLIAMARTAGRRDLFNGGHENPGWTNIHQEVLCTASVYEDETVPHILEMIDERWQQFLRDLPDYIAAVDLDKV